MQHNKITTYIKRHVNHIKMIDFTVIRPCNDIRFDCADGVSLYFSKFILNIRNIDYFNSIIFNDFKDINEPIVIEYNSNPFNCVLNCIYYETLIMTDNKDLNIMCYKILHYVHYLADDVANEINNMMRDIKKMDEREFISLFDISILYYNLLSNQTKLHILYGWSIYDKVLPITRNAIRMIEAIDINAINYCACHIFAITSKLVKLLDEHNISLLQNDFDNIINRLSSVNCKRKTMCSHYDIILGSYKDIITSAVVMENARDPIIKKFVSDINAIYLSDD